VRSYNRKQAKRALDAKTLGKRPKRLSEDTCKEDTVFILPLPLRGLREKLSGLFRKFKTLSLHSLDGV